MNPQGFIKQEPMPEILWRMGRKVANVWQLISGFRINDFEGYMIIVSSTLILISIVVWIIIDIGNERDRAEAEEANEQVLLLPRGRRESKELTRKDTEFRKQQAAVDGGDSRGRNPEHGSSQRDYRKSSDSMTAREYRKASNQSFHRSSSTSVPSILYAMKRDQPRISMESSYLRSTTTNKEDD
ncbi:hypothetical protein CEUSTIGMA_g11199.t1 [Chlamydomonas eustigma]|uniref:Uncharacterized protein n=1 Tax=Chlamydomonas eustigma TaxID=1157962 RepID=A0A250XL25_9CHLO|nr:hypothetical protein CEUSTIGMA_g11199.t1 [Chlamydomonas eustigma]|eukprot:GAX83774.1 hypothetical protein CEUSTIGMA_g11199.t1 [Chlamydomonas eustigma]